MQDFSEKSPYVNARSSLENTIYVTSVRTLILSKPAMLVSSVQNILKLSTDPLTTFQPRIFSKCTEHMLTFMDSLMESGSLEVAPPVPPGNEG